MSSFTFAIGIPTINRYDLLRPFLKEYLVNFPLTEIYIIDNGNQGIIEDDITVHLIIPEQPLGVAASWNLLCDKIFKKHKFALILNDDILLNKNDLGIFNFLTLNKGGDFYVSQNGFCSFILPKETFQKIGAFDERFVGAYFEDRDYERRMILAKMKVIRHAFLNPSIFNESSSIKKDEALNKNYKNNWQYYCEKWGGSIGGEKYLTPFNK
jgi:GT2 family glycosyltransferase